MNPQAAELLARLHQDNEEYQRPRPHPSVTVDSIFEFVQQLIDQRREWADSEKGREVLGPGSPTIPGLQEYHRVLDYIETGSKNPFAKR